MKIKLLFTLIYYYLHSPLNFILRFQPIDQIKQNRHLLFLLGHIQIETGISIEDSQSNINTLFRIGIINGIEVRLNSNYLMNDNITAT